MTPGSLPARQPPAAADRLVRTFAASREQLLRALTHHLGSADDAQDVLQDAFLKCWRRRARLGGVRNLRAWVFRVGLNAARDLARNAWRRRSRPLTTTAVPDARPAVSPADSLLDREQLDRLSRALRRLRPAERAVFLLRQNSDLTYEQIAARRGVPVGTVKTQMRAALHKLRTVLHGEP